MRKLVVLAVTASLVACGSSSNKKPVDRTFTPKATRASTAWSGADACDLPGFPTLFSANALAIELTTAGADAAASGTIACNDPKAMACQYYAQSQSLEIMLAKVNLTSPYEKLELAQGGTYEIYQSPWDAAKPGLPSITLGLAHFTSAGAGPDPACAPTTALAAASGTVTLDPIPEGGPITGRISMTFSDASTFSSPFSADICPEAIASTAVCQRAFAASLCAGSHCGP